LLHLTRYPTLEQIKNAYNALVNYLQIPVYTGQDKTYTFRFDEFIRNFKLNSQEALYALKALESDGWLDFNERNFSPSTLVFTTNKNGLYEFQKSYPQHENLLITLLRTYGGIFDFPAFISENLIARLLKKVEIDIKLQLKTIASFGIIQYVPQNNEPQIILRKNRVVAEELPFNLMPYYKRRDVFVGRVKKMIEYIQTSDCRSKTIGLYFGDKKAGDCGVCDNCLRKKSTQLSAKEFDAISTAIMNHVSKQSITIDDLLSHLKNIKKEKAWKVLSFLQAEKKILVNETGLLLTNNSLSQSK
jgi:ATP-dependent DNA helicase RecQ